MQRILLLCRYIWQLMYVMESKIIQSSFKSLCPAPKSCHPSQCSATCNLFCRRLSHYVSARINCIVRFSRVPAASASAPIFAEGLVVSDAASVFKGIGHWGVLILFLESFIFFSSVPLGAAPRLPQRMWRGGHRSGCAPRLCWDTAPVGTVLRDPKRGARSLSLPLAFSWRHLLVNSLGK